MELTNGLLAVAAKLCLLEASARQAEVPSMGSGVGQMQTMAVEPEIAAPVTGRTIRQRLPNPHGSRRGQTRRKSTST